MAPATRAGHGRVARGAGRGAVVGRGRPRDGRAARDLDRLLDRFRDDVRDTARDHGITDAQLTDARAHLSTAAARIDALLRGRKG